MEKSYLPLVSIVIPVYNGANYVGEAIESALAQTYEKIEVIVINDGSNDNEETEKVISKYIGKIRYIKKENGGSSSALNCGIDNMTGEWFSWLSHDDLYEPMKIQMQVECINQLNLTEKDLYKHFFFTASELIDSEGKVIRRRNFKREQLLASRINQMVGNQYIIAEQSKYNFHGCGCLIHRKAFEEVGRFNESLRLLNDLDMWYRLYTGGFRLHYVPNVLVKGRVHEKQVSHSIGFSHINLEQDWYNERSFQWLLKNYPNDDCLFYLFGKNAYLNSRYLDGDRAFALAASISLKKKLILSIMKSTYCLRARIRMLAKKIYIAIKL